jgi:hypothetical protein
MELTKFITFKEFFHDSISIPSDHQATYLAEIAGKDSIAAILKATQNCHITNLIGVGVLHRSFFGNEDEPIEHFKHISTRKSSLKIEKTEFLYLDVRNLFDQLIIRPMAIIQKNFHYYSPCPACHLFFHMMRIPVARKLKIKTFITGERNYHGERKKLNQLPEVLSLYKSLLKKEGIELVQPLKDIKQDNEIFDILGSKWISAKPFKCSFSRNYYDENGDISFNLQNILRAISQFYYPLFAAVITFIESNQFEPDEQWIQATIKNIITKLL